MNVEYINPFTHATFEVLSMFGSLDPKVGKPAVKDDALVSTGVVVVVGIIGEVKGQVAYTFTEDTAKAIASAMMMGMPVDVFDEMAKSAVSELANMISGHASTAIAAKGFTIDIAPPTLVTGENVRIATNVKKNLVIPIESTAGKCMCVIGRLKLMNNEDLIEMYLEKLSDSEKSKTLCESILNDLNTFKEFILEKKFIDVDREILIKFVEYLKDNFSNNTVIKKLNSCRAFFSYLNEKGFINENILKEIKNLKKSFSIPEVLTYEELEILLGSCETNDKGLRDKLVISLMVATGMQLNKVLELETSSVDENIIIFEKNNKKYIIKVEENLRNIIASYKNSKICGKNKLFEGLSRQNFFARIKKCQEKAGIKKKINPAMLRNTSLFNFIEEGVSVKELKEKLDYVNIGSTGIYKVRNKSDIKRIYEKIGIGDWDVSEFN